MSTPPLNCYFCIKKEVYNENAEWGDDRYVGVANLGKLTAEEAEQVFEGVTRRLVEIIRWGSEEGWSVIADKPLLLRVSECDDERTYVKDWTEYALRFEHEVDSMLLLEWKMQSESFFQSRYQDSLRQLDLDVDNVYRPKNDTILAAAVRAAELVRRKTVNDDAPSTTSVPAQKPKRRGRPPSPRSPWVIEQCFNNGKKPAEIRELWNSLTSSEGTP